MDKINKKDLSEADICDLYITPSIKLAGYDPLIQIRREVYLSPGRIDVFGLSARRNKKTRKRADYVLYKKKNIPIAVVEAKNNNFTVSEGMPQAIKYASLLKVPSAFSSNGDGFSYLDMSTNSKEIEKNLKNNEFIDPETLWKNYLDFYNIKKGEEHLNLEDYYVEDNKEPRYYQVNAINSLVQQISNGKKRLLIVMATGTGKTYVAFQTIWRLWKSKKVKRALFLADRNILIDQSIVNDFKPFKKVMTKIQNRNADPSYEIYMALYQSLTGDEEKSKIFKNFSKDFFDLIIIDECHRGSADEESQWREILEYFNSSVQIGMTATPKETKYISNIDYFGEPIYTYSLKQGIEDGFLSPYKVIRVNLDKDMDGWIPPPGMKDDLGELIENRKYNQLDMNKTLILNHRTKIVAKRVMDFLRKTNPYDKTIIFCEDIDHAERMRVAISNEASEFLKKSYNYFVRITGDNPESPEHLDDFIDPENKFPVIAITSKLMSTGVDARTCKVIVLDKNINSMTEFKQIIGRGTRVLEDKDKMFFTILDFKNATRNFFEPEFDGEPVNIKEVQNFEKVIFDEDPNKEKLSNDIEETKNSERKKYYIKDLEVSILSEQIQYLDKGKLVTKNLIQFTKEKILRKYKTLDLFIKDWNKADKKKIIIDELKNEGIFFTELKKELGYDYEPFDIICNLVFNQKPLTRRERALDIIRKDIFSKYSEAAKQIMKNLVEKYADQGIEQIEDIEILKVQPFNSMGTPMEIINKFGGIEKYDSAIKELTNNIYN